MKLFELYQQNTQQGTDNLKQISEAVENKTSAVITVGNTQVKLGINSARYVFGLYETAVANGTSEKFLEGLANLNASTLMENENTMRHIVSKFKHEVKNFVNGDDLDTDLYHALFDYYSDHGEMPYGIAKARDGDPYEWVTMHFDRDVHDYAGPDDLNPDAPAVPAATMPMMPRQESMYESKQVKEGWAEMMADVKARAEKEKAGRGTGKFDKKTTGTGTVYSRKYNADTGQSIEPTIDPEGKPPVKRSVGRPSAGVSGASEEGTKFGEYSSWYHKSKRTHAGAGIVGSRANALAVVPKGAKYLVVGKWSGDEGTMFSAPKEVISKDELAKYQAGRGRRSTKVREWIETLRFVSEGAVGKKKLSEGYDGSEPLDLSTNPSVNDVFKRALYIYDYEGYGNDGDYSEDDAIDQYVARKFGQDVLDQLTHARNQQYFGRADGKGPGGGGRTSNLGTSSAPGGNFRTTKAGIMNKQDAKMMKAKVADRLGRHPEPNLPEGTVTKTATGIKHTATDKYGAGEEDRAPQDAGKYAKDLDGLNKNLTSKLDKSMGVKHDHGNKKK